MKRSKGELMELYACPMCGSELFVSTRSGKRIVFQMDVERHPVHVWPEQQPADAVPINPQNFCCGACFWHGSMEELVESWV
jgi:uncharacterized protein YbaR (Trm112 family)